MENESTITEGEDAVVRLSVPVVMSESLDIKLAIAFSGDFGDGIQNQTVLLESGTDHIDFVVSTIDDDVYEPHGSATISILNDENYILPQDDNSKVSFTVLDDDEPDSSISILSLEEEIVEGDIAHFQVQTATAVSTATIVKIQISTTGAFLQQSYLETITFLPGEKYKIIEVPTINDEVYETDAEINAELQPNSNFQLAESFTRGTITVLDNDLPTVSIAKSFDIFEGEDVTFRLEFPEPVFEDITVSVAIACIR